MHEHIREMGGQGVPSDGGWPLSLSNTLHKSYYDVNIDDYERNKQIDLKVRYENFVLRQREKELKQYQDHPEESCSGGGSNVHGGNHRNHAHGKQQHHNHHRPHSHHHHITEMDNKRKQIIDNMPVYIPKSNDGHTDNNNTSTDDDNSYTFETRQFDHRKTSTFDFKYRISCNDTSISVSDINMKHEEEKLQSMEFNAIKNSGRNILFAPLREHERKAVLLCDHAIFMESPDLHYHPSNSGGKKSNHVQEHDLYELTTIRHVRNELESIRIHRSETDSTGCSCRKLNVTLPNQNVGGKNHHHRRLTERKVKEELRKRHVPYSPKMKRDELEKLLYDTVEEQGCCYGNDCVCVRNGINCQLDTCSCWYDSHSGGSSSHHRKGNDSEIPSPSEVLRKCGNKYGCYVVDFEKIEESRSRYINAVEKKLCLECI